MLTYLTEKMAVFAPADSRWLDRFHAGDRATLEQCYRDHFGKALAAAVRILSGVDAETVAHEVFYRVLSDGGIRRGFSGGNLGAWIAQVTTNLAIDHHRRRRREVRHEEGVVPEPEETARVDEEVEAKMLVERFRRERLPAKWQALFEVRFLRQLPQREAAQALGIQRSTLAYQEDQVRALLTDFVLASEDT
jgi:RNA polymerase sigma-70 factor (ECF subfamily)